MKMMRETLAESFMKSKQGRKRSRKDKDGGRYRSSPNRKPRSASRKSNEIARDLSRVSGISKDEVMPCYKSKFEGKKRVDVAHQPKPLAPGYIKRPMEQIHSPSQAIARDLLFQENVVGVRYQQHRDGAMRNRTQEGPEHMHRHQVNSDSVPNEGKIT